MPQTRDEIYKQIVSERLAQLPAIDATFEWYDREDVAPIVGLKRTRFYQIAGELWPQKNRRSHWRLTHAQACQLIRAVSFRQKRRLIQEARSAQEGAKLDDTQAKKAKA